MRRWHMLLIMTFVAVMAPALLAAGMRESTAHQQSELGESTGVSTEALGAQESQSDAGQRLHLLRVTFAPGGSVGSHMHPGSTIYHLEQGELIFTLLSGDARLVRAGQAEDAPAEMIPLDEAITLSAGDTIYYDGFAVQTERNDGKGDAVVLISNLRGSEEPARVFVENRSQSHGGTP